MTKKNKIADLPKFDIAELLEDNQDIAANLSIVIEDGDAAEHCQRRSDFLSHL